MQKLKNELNRLYLANTQEGSTRAIYLAFPRLADDGETAHWDRLCVVANALQEKLGLPAPAVCIDGAKGYGLWLSLQDAAPAATAQQFAQLLVAAYCPEMALAPDAARATAQLPPQKNPDSGKWSAFIHPGMGAAFAEEPGLDIQPPEAGQLGFLEGLNSIDAAQFAQALAQLAPAEAASQPAARETTNAAPLPDQLLLKDATLEDIVKYLHSKNIEPTFRHLLPK
jgi:hypothetical protein